MALRSAPMFDGIGKEQQTDDAVDEPRRIVSAQVPCDAMTRRSTDARTDFLDRGHERVREQHRPADSEAELGAGLAVGSMPEGSSSEAPAMSPGPSSLRRRRMNPFV